MANIKSVQCASCVPYDAGCDCEPIGSDGSYELFSGIVLTDANGIKTYVRRGYNVVVDTGGGFVSIVNPDNGQTIRRIYVNDTSYNSLQELAAAICACNGQAQQSGGGVSLPLVSQTYNSDADAGAAGIPIDGLYWTGSEHVLGESHGLLKMRKS